MQNQFERKMLNLLMSDVFKGNFFSKCEKEVFQTSFCCQDIFEVAEQQDYVEIKESESRY